MEGLGREMLTAAGVLSQTCEQRVGAPPHRHTKAGLTKVIADLKLDMPLLREQGWGHRRERQGVHQGRDEEEVARHRSGRMRRAVKN